MNYEAAFEALNNGDFVKAADLLEKLAESTGFDSDLVNHSLTLALYRSNNYARLADVSFKVGMMLISTDPASALDYFQRAVRAGLESSRVRQIGEIHEEWAAERRAAKLPSVVSRVGHVVTSMAAADSMSTYIRMLARELSTLGVESTVFTTEATSAWFVHPSGTAGTGESESEVLIASTEGDFKERARRIAATVHALDLPVVFFHGDLSDQIAACVAGIDTGAVHVNVAHERVMDADLFSGFVHLLQPSLEASRFKSHPAVCIPAAPDRVADPTSSRSAMGIDADSTVSLSFAGPTRDQMGFVKVLVELLKRFPKHFHLFAGGSDVRAFRGLLHSEGVLTRVRFLGQTSDPAAVIGNADMGFAAFPNADSAGILDMMASGKPVLLMREPGTVELLGNSELTPASTGAYIQIADSLIRNAGKRDQLGELLRNRFLQEFSPKRMAERYVAFLDQLR